MNDHQSGMHPDQEAESVASQEQSDSPGAGMLLSRRSFFRTTAGLAAFSTGGIAYLVTATPAFASSPTDTTSNTIVFGNSTSETAAKLQQVNSTVITNALGWTARQCNPPSGSLTFTLPCDPVNQNYLTVKFWGSDLDAAGGQLVLIDIHGTSLPPEYEYGKDHPEIDRLMPTAAFPGRFFYATELLPLSLTTGRSQLTLTIESLGQASPYTPGQPVSPQVDPSRGLYSATVHTNAFYTPDPSEVVGQVPPAGQPLPSPDGLSPYDHVVAQVELLIDTLRA